MGAGGHLYDRRDGQRSPALRTLYDLDLIRGYARALVELNPLAQGIVSYLTSFVIGSGYPLNVLPRTPGPRAMRQLAPLCHRVQRVWEEFEEREEFGERQREIFAASVIDGEALLRHFSDRGYT
ncbi:MAG: hypothetical protein ACKOJF_34415, partial [Planctomycetaceae bacterium]